MPATFSKIKSPVSEFRNQVSIDSTIPASRLPAALRDEVLADHRKTADYPGLHHRIAIAQLFAEDGQQGRSLPVLAAGQQPLQSGRNPHDQLVVLQAIEVAEKKGLQTGSDPLRLAFSLPRLDDASRLLEAEKMPALAGMQQLRQGLVRQRQGRVPVSGQAQGRDLLPQDGDNPAKHLGIEQVDQRLEKECAETLGKTLGQQGGQGRLPESSDEQCCGRQGDGLPVFFSHQGFRRRQHCRENGRGNQIFLMLHGEEDLGHPRGQDLDGLIRIGEHRPQFVAHRLVLLLAEERGENFLLELGNLQGIDRIFLPGLLQQFLGELVFFGEKSIQLQAGGEIPAASLLLDLFYPGGEHKEDLIEDMPVNAGHQHQNIAAQDFELPEHDQVGDRLQLLFRHRHAAEHRFLVLQTDHKVTVVAEIQLYRLVSALHGIGHLRGHCRIQANRHNGAIERFERLKRISMPLCLFHCDGS